MLLDLQRAADHYKISSSEFVRRAITEKMLAMRVNIPLFKMKMLGITGGKNS